MSRPSWDEVWMSVADVIADRSKCVRRGVGAVIVDVSNRVVATGYNGPPANFRADGMCNEWCPRSNEEKVTLNYHSCISVHAELNAINWADRTRMEGGTIYVSSASCWDCSKVVANCGVRRVVMRVEARDEHRNPEQSIKFLKDCGLIVDVVREVALA